MQVVLFGIGNQFPTPIPHGTLHGEVTDVVYQGSFKRVTARVNGVDLLARLPADAAVSAGQRISLGIDPAHAIVLKD